MSDPYRDTAISLTQKIRELEAKLQEIDAELSPNLKRRREVEQPLQQLYSQVQRNESARRLRGAGWQIIAGLVILSATGIAIPLCQKSCPPDRSSNDRS